MSARPAAAPHAPGRAGFAGADLGICVVLLVVTLALYAPVRHHAFLNYDDNEYVTEHPVVRHGLGAASIRWALTSVHHATWHPLTSLSHLLDVTLFGLDAGAHLLVNVGLHALATLVLFLALRAMTGARWPSAVVAALFAWHPLHVESVAWVSERKDVLSGLCWMSTLAAYGAYVRRPTWPRYAAVVAIFAAGLLAKPMLVTLPCVLLLLDWWPLRRVGGAAAALRLVREKVLLFVLAGGVSVATVVAQRSAGALHTLDAVPFAYRIGNALVSYAAYVQKTLWPTGLAVFYPSPSHLSAWSALAAGLFVLAVTAWIAAEARRRPFLAVGWLWYLGTLVPVIGLVRQGDQAMADRFTYLPSIGLFILAAFGLPSYATGPAARRGLAAATAVALAACVLVSARQVTYWRDSLTLFAHAVAVTEDNHVAHGNLALALSAAGRRDEAMAHYERAVAIAPDQAKTRVNLGHALAAAGRTAEAEAAYAEALRRDPRSALAAYDLGLLHAERGELDVAIDHYRRALAIDPGYAKAANNLGWTLAAQGAPTAAVAAYEQALAADPDLVAAHNNLAVTLADLGRLDEAIAHATTAVALAPGEPRAHANRGALLARAGRAPEAVAAFREALRIAPDLEAARLDLAAMLARAGDTTTAIAEYREVLRRRPDAADAAEALAALGAHADDASSAPGRETAR